MAARDLCYTPYIQGVVVHRLVIALLIALSCDVFASPVAAETVRCLPNIFGGQDCETPEGRITSQPNIFGGQDYTLPDGRRIRSQPNIFGGEDYRGQRGERVPPIVPFLGNPERPQGRGK